MKRLSISAKMQLALAPLGLLALVVVLITFSSLRDNSAPLIRAQATKELAVTSLSLLLMQDDATKAMMLDPDNPSLGLRKIKAYDSNNSVLQEIRKSNPPVAVLQTLDEMSRLDDRELRPLDTSILELLGDAKAAAAKQLYFRKYEPARKQYEQLVHRMVSLAQADATKAAARVHDENGRSLRNISGTLLLGTLLVALPLIILARSVQRSLERSVDRLGIEAAGAQSTSQQLSETSQSLSEGVASAATSIEGTTQSLHELACMISQSRDHSERTCERGRQTVQRADRVSLEMRSMQSAMQEIKQASLSVSKIIRVIDEIAFQTNILALNAAVEAARAGETGLGFAVVADEVRRLAQRSATAAADTSALIEAAIRKSEQGSALSEKVSAELNQIVEDAHESDRLISAITTACQEEHQQVQQIGESLAIINVAVQCTALEAQDRTETAHMIQSQANAVLQIQQELMAFLASEK